LLFVKYSGFKAIKSTLDVFPESGSTFKIAEKRKIRLLAQGPGNIQVGFCSNCVGDKVGICEGDKVGATLGDDVMFSLSLEIPINLSNGSASRKSR
jgi:hypothetical protein